MAFSQVATCLAIRGNTSKSMALTDLFGRLSHSLIRSNARAILSRSYSPLCSRWMNFVCNCLYCVWLCVDVSNKNVHIIIIIILLLLLSSYTAGLFCLVAN